MSHNSKRIFPLLIDIVKGDSIPLEATLAQDITDWKIRCEIWDNSNNCIKLATANSGGANSQIEITNPTEGEFIINVGKDLTTCFDDKAFIEIEVENTETPVKQFTIHQGEIEFIIERIEWKTP